MKQYFETQDGKIVNLDNVSNIVFDEEWTDRFGNHKPKIIFNFAYPVSLPRSDKKISDYVYLIFKSKEEYKAAEKDLEQLINEKGWIAPVINNKIEKIINPDKISFMTHDDDNLRIILNLSASVSFHGDYDRLTSDFCYLNHTDWTEYQNNLSYIRGLLKLKEF
jgi:hypothetical protein